MTDVARCVTCGNELHPERAEKYSYCIRPGCQMENRRDVTIVSVGVNKAADQYVVLNERTEQEMATGRYQDPRRGSYGGYERPRVAARARPGAEAAPLPTPRPEISTESWTEAQQQRALSMFLTGNKPVEEIARRLGLTERTVADMLSEAYARARR